MYISNYSGFNSSSYYLNALSSISSKNSISALSSYYNRSNSLSSYAKLYSNPSYSYSSVSASTNKLLRNFDTYYKDLQDDASNLRSSFSNLKNNTYTSKDSSIADVSSTRTSSSNAITLEVTELAEKQTNTSDALESSSKNNFSTGYNSFSIRKDDKIYELNVDIKSLDSNKDVLTKVADKINASRVGLTAVVKEDAGKSYMEISSKEGAKNSFSIQDGNSSLASTIGLDQITNTAKDASFKLNDKTYTASSNKVSINNGEFKLSLKSTGSTQLNSKKDTSTVVDAVKDFISSYNDALSLVNDSSNKNTTKLNILKNSLSGAAYSYKYSLQNIGINRKDDGTLSLDESRLSEALTNNTSGTTQTLKAIADKVDNSTELGLNASKISLLAEQSNSSNIFSTQSSYYGTISSLLNHPAYLSSYYASMMSLGLFADYGI